MNNNTNTKINLMTKTFLFTTSLMISACASNAKPFVADRISSENISSKTVNTESLNTDFLNSEFVSSELLSSKLANSDNFNASSDNINVAEDEYLKQIQQVETGIGNQDKAFLQPNTPEATLAHPSDEQWGIAAYYRQATIPYNDSYGGSQVNSFIPMMFYQGEYLYIDGLEGGSHLYTEQDNKYQINALIRARFVDITRAKQNETGGDSADAGLQYRYYLGDKAHLDTELMLDKNYYMHSNISLSSQYQLGDLQITPKITARYKSADFNSEYYALKSFTEQSIGAGVDYSASVDLRYHLFSNLFLLGRAGITYLDDNAYSADIVDQRWQSELYTGFGFFNDPKSPRQSTLTIPPYLSFAHGWATPSNMGDILSLNGEKDPYNNQMSSVFYGHPVSDNLFGLPIDIYLTSGLAHHWSSEVQSNSTEYIVAIKGYYTFDWPTKMRFGVAEGLSYIDSLTYIEASEMERKGYEGSNLLNYLDFSLDVNLGDLFNKPSMDNLWFGYSLHHRSAIFESSSMFGRIKGGSNYNTLYIQYDF